MNLLLVLTHRIVLRGLSKTEERTRDGEAETVTDHGEEREEGERSPQQGDIPREVPLLCLTLRRIVELPELVEEQSGGDQEGTEHE
jgi:hypothetical protein